MWYTWGRWKGADVGVIDAIAEGCFAVARRPVLLLPPVLLDLLYWAGGRLTVAPLTDAYLRLARGAGVAVEPGLADGLNEFAAGSDLFALLSLWVNALLPQLDADRVARPWGRGVLDPGHWSVVLLGGIALTLLGLLLFALYLAGVAQLVREEPFDPRQIARRAPACWLRLLGLYALMAGGVLLLGMPIFLLAALLALAGAGTSVGPLLVLFILPLLWLYCFLALAPEAVAVSEAGPLQALKLSVRVVRRNFWPTIGLLAATILITTGLPFGWRALTPNPAGVPLAIAGNAYVATGLTAAAMVFYRERLAALEEQSGSRAVGQSGRGRR